MRGFRQRLSESGACRKIKQQVKVWRAGALPGLAVAGLVVVARLTGSLQTLEWMALDRLLQLRPIEARDPRVVIVGIDEQDINAAGKFPIPNRDLAQALRIIESYQPRAIGLDIFKDLVAEPDRAELTAVFKNAPNLVVIETVLNRDTNVKPPPEVPPERVGFADSLLDPDNKLRRSLLAGKIRGSETIEYSLPLRLAALYLRSEGIQFQPNTQVSQPLRFGTTELPRFLANSGGYVDARAGGNQILLNFRAHPEPFPTVSLQDILGSKVSAELMRDRIVLVGMTASSVKDNFATSALPNPPALGARIGGPSADQYQLLYGVVMHAHATSQIISAVLDGRPMIRVWTDGWEYLWIVLWGLSGITLGLVLQSPWKTILSIGLGSAGLIGICYVLLIWGWWVPVVPTLLAFCAAGLTSSFFDRDLRILLEQRSLTLKRTYDAVHNGPLQTLAAMLRSIDEAETSPEQLRSQLQCLNRELRSVYESMNQEISSGETPYSEIPLQELLYQVYEETLLRDFKGFTTIRTFIPPDFSSLEALSLTADQKRSLCTFLQEALCNVGKHAVGATRLDVVCSQDENWCSLRVIDNGTSSLLTQSPDGGRGTEQAKELARQLRGKFQRRPHSPQGTVCELSWPLTRGWRFRWLAALTKHLSA
ncbi:CHASE2 domain-containing protein [Leptolyngbya sp. FACHB-261]|uniref:CHASE2 domain-containing protein n=1 Tax=Leptolyngbya sp. FACHB-261 TaxID=2692806 RepID=UPI0016870EB5|nr:CHASE2 domain-containing protein [Leptolyngbya sp. FACHB-261]MBD2102466.1 CHASE2 domain-containing protein [Leptolyngbya sp. FACHB-261]